MSINRRDRGMRIDAPGSEVSSAATGSIASARNAAMSSPLMRLWGRLDRARKAFAAGDLQTTEKHAAKVIAAADKLGATPDAAAMRGSAHLLMGHIAAAAHDDAGADTAYRRAVEELSSAHDIVWERGDYVADLGVAMVMCEQPDAAAVLARALELGEDTVEVRRYLGLSLLRDGDTAQAEELLADLVRRVPTDWQAYWGLALIAERTAPAPEAAASWLAAAEAARAAEQLGEALEAYRASDRLSPSTDAKRGFAASLGQLGLYDDAERAARDVLAENPDDYEARCVHIEALLGLEQAAAAAAAARELIERDPDDPIAHAYLGIARGAMGEFGDAVTSLAQAHQLLPESSPLRIELAQALRAAGRIDDAARLLDDGIRGDPVDINMRLHRAECAIDTDDIDQAAVQVAAVAGIEPARAPWLTLSREMASRSDFHRALSAADQQLVITPGDPEALGLRGAILVDLGELDDGIAALSASAQAEPAADTMSNLARALLTRAAPEDFVRAEEAARWVHDNEADAYRGAVLLAWALYLLDRSGEALELLDTVAREHGPDGDLEGLRMQVLLDLDRVPEALEAAQQAVALLPNDAEAHSQLGRLYSDLAASDPERAEQYTSAAIEELAVAVDLDAADMDSAVLLGRLHLQRNDYSSAETLLATAVRQCEAAGQAPDAAALDALARAQYEQGSLEAALCTADASLEVGPARHGALVTKGEALFALERASESVEAFEAALAIDPDDSYVLASLGESLRVLGEFDKARPALDTALAQRPDFAWALASRGALNHATGDIDAAVLDLEAAIRLSPAYRFALVRYTDVLLALGREPDVVPAWETAIEAAPENAGLRTEYADTLRRVNRPADGLAHIENALRAEPDDVLALRVHGRILLDLGRIDEAVAQFERAVSHAPRASEAVIDLAGARERQGRPLDALQTTQNCIDRNPTVELLIDHGWRLARLAAFREADHCASRALELASTSAHAYGLRGWASPMIDRLDEAVAAAEQALYLEPEFRWHHTLLGNTLWAAGRTEEAMSHYQWVVDRADEIADSDARGLHALGWSLACLGDHKRASRCLAKARALGYDELSVMVDLGLNSFAAGQLDEGRDTYDEALSIIDRARSSRHKANNEAALLNRGTIAVAIYDLRTGLAGGRLQPCDFIDDVIDKLTQRLADLPLPPELTAPRLVATS